jgi:hypothetical protein
MQGGREMYCEDLRSCYSEINAYCSGKPSGRALLVNTENYDVYQQIRETLEADTTKKCTYVSASCPDAGLPDIEEIINRVSGAGYTVLIGLSQAAMLRSATYLENLMGLLLEKAVRGYLIILLDHCEPYLKKHFSVHPDIQKRVVLMAGEASTLPRIRVSNREEAFIGTSPLPNMRSLLAYLERLTDAKCSECPEVAAVTRFSPALFGTAVYSVSACDGVYETLSKQYPEIAAGTEKQYGNDTQWEFLASQMQAWGSVSAVAENVFGATVNLQMHIGQVVEEENENKTWLLWLSMKLFGTRGNRYLSIVLQNSKQVADFEEHVYLDLLSLKYDDRDFRQCYIERKQLIDDLPENLTLQDKYCERVGIYQKNAAFYLTDASEKEELTFMQCLATYRYTESELLRITENTFPALYSYLQKFTFNATNTKVPETEENLREKLTAYFQQYKLQKLTNRIEPDFLRQVEEYACSRPYNKLQARSAVISKMDKKKAQLYFFDALGVEYLAYIMERCEKYDLIAEVSVAQCALPSITSKNKEFLQFFPDKVYDIKELDELKHHSQTIDYEQCKYPVHLFRELEIIDTELQKIRSGLKQGAFEKAVIVSDHGASRLAVIHEQETALLELEEKGQHSGRCCPVEKDPKIPFASYWDGYSILANYDRFKGGRKANVEVHGGASLEEVVVPIITLRKRPADVDICFTDPIIVLKGKEPATITVFANIPLHEPKLVVNEKEYKGQLAEDGRHAVFVMPELKRTRDWLADFYDGDKKWAAGLAFRIQKGTQEQTLFKKMPF